jgi:hypothetical protein
MKKSIDCPYCKKRYSFWKATFKTMCPNRCKCTNCGQWLYYNRFGSISYSVSIMAGIFLGLFLIPISEALNIPIYFLCIGSAILLVAYACLWWRYFDFKNTPTKEAEQGGDGDAEEAV